MDFTFSRIAFCLILVLNFSGGTAVRAEDTGRISLFLCGDVMTGRGIDQILPHPGDPALHEPYMRSAVGYVEIAEQVNGPIPDQGDFSYIWGDALSELEQSAPDLRIINLETSITDSDESWPGKGIHYRMHPENTPCITAADIDLAVLANNHVLDWGYGGLTETLVSLSRHRVRTVGAGESASEASSGTIFDIPGTGRVIVFAAGHGSSGISGRWAAGRESAGVHYLADLSDREIDSIKERIEAVKRPGDAVIFSVHWGGNWGYRIPREHRRFARALIDEAGVDIIYGHSSHHPMGIEVYNRKLVLYGCGDFINDYEGIGGHEEYKPDLALMYLPEIELGSGDLVSLRMVPFRIKKFRLHYADNGDAAWLEERLGRECRKLGTGIIRREGRGGKPEELMLQW